jgi:hypothetical protein
MWWNQITKGWKQLVVIVASPRPSPNSDSRHDASIRADAAYGDRYEEPPLPPYSPDKRVERNDSSLHLSC